MYRRIKIFILTILSLIGLHSCRPILYKIYGVDPIENFDEDKYDKVVNIFNSEYDNISSYISEDKSFKEYSNLDSTIKNDLGQPIQILYFDGDTLKSFHANCYAKGSITGNLNWNYADRFESFIPKSATDIENKNIKLSDIKQIYSITNKTDGITVVFFWTNFLGKASIRAFNTITDNIKTYSTYQDVNIIAINTDYSFLFSE